MNTIYYFSTEPEFQAKMESVFDIYRSLQANHPDALSEINLNKNRVVAAAIFAASNAKATRLVQLAKPKNLPSRTYRDEKGPTIALHKTVHLTPSMGDYLKAGASKLNIEYFGPKEDRALEKDPKAERLRITERQYMHLAIIYLAQMTERNIKAAFLGSQDIYPFKPAGRKKATGNST